MNTATYTSKQSLAEAIGAANAGYVYLMSLTTRLSTPTGPVDVVFHSKEAVTVTPVKRSDPRTLTTPRVIVNVETAPPLSSYTRPSKKKTSAPALPAACNNPVEAAAAFYQTYLSGIEAIAEADLTRYQKAERTYRFNLLKKACLAADVSVEAALAALKA